MSALTRGRWIFAGLLYAMLVACSSSDEPTSTSTWMCPTLDVCRQSLKVRSDEETKALGASQREGSLGQRKIAVIGDGIAGTALARNLKAAPVRVYGSPSFWTGLEALPAIWQTSLTGSFKDAQLVLSESKGNTRLKREDILLFNLDGLVRADAAYLSTGPVFVTPGKNKTWTIVDSEGHGESIAGPVVVATGLLRPLRITDKLSDADSVRRRAASAHARESHRDGG